MSTIFRERLCIHEQVRIMSGLPLKDLTVFVRAVGDAIRNAFVRAVDAGVPPRDILISVRPPLGSLATNREPVVYIDATDRRDIPSSGTEMELPK